MKNIKILIKCTSLDFIVIMLRMREKAPLQLVSQTLQSQISRLRMRVERALRTQAHRI